jgi:hypothetical protein
MSGVFETLKQAPAALLVGVLILAWAFAVSAQSDVILLDHSGSSLDKERGPVVFPHGLHMNDLDCLSCHHQYQDGENVLDAGDLDEDTAACSGCHDVKTACRLMETFHTQCLGCHNKLLDEGEPTGPRLCVGCHPKTTK